MKTPYEQLEIEENNDDNTIRQAYLRMIKKFPPDRDSDRFQRIHDAYMMIENEEKRMKYELFNRPQLKVNELVELIEERSKYDRPSRQLLCRLLGESIFKY